MAEIPDWLQRNGNMITHATVITLLLASLGVDWKGGELGLATRQYVDDSVRVVQQKAEDNGRNIDKILELNLVRELEKLYRFKCMNPGSSTVDGAIAQYESEYRTITGNPYVARSCDFLMHL